jgi:hypothetical protein
MGQKKNAYRILVEKPDGKRPLGRSRHAHRWEGNIKISLWIDLAQVRVHWWTLVNMIINEPVP